MATRYFAALVIAGLTFSFVDSFSESRLEVISIAGVGITRDVLAFHNKGGLCRWTLFEKKLSSPFGISSSKWYLLAL